MENEYNKKSKKEGFQIIELFLIKAGKKDFKRTFVGGITKELRENDETLMRCRVRVEEGMIIGMAKTREELGANLDDICLMKLDFGLHKSKAIATSIFYNDFNHN